MKPLSSRKQILIAESELNRAQLVEDWQTLAGEVHALAEEARTLRSIASSATSLVAGLVSFRRKKIADTNEKPSFLKTILKSAGHVSNLWMAFRSPVRDQKDK